MKRQKECAEQMATMVCKKVIDARAMLKYVIETTPTGAERILEMYEKHLSNTVNRSVGTAREIVPTFVGDHIDDLKKDVVAMPLEVLPDHLSEVEQYMDEVMKVQETLAWRL